MTEEKKRKKKINRRAKGEGSIFQRKDGTWISKIPTGYHENGKIKYRYISGKTQSDVKDKTDNIKADVTLHQYTEPNKILLGNYAKTWLDVIMKNSIKDTTYLLYKYIVDKHIKPELGGMKLIMVTSIDVQKMYNKKNEKFSAQTVHHMHNVLKQIFSNAISEKLRNNNPCDTAKLPKIKKQEMSVLTKEQINHLLDFSKNSKHYSRLYSAYYLELSTGLRRGELLGLRWKDIDMKRELIKINQQLVKVGSQNYIRELKTETSQNRTIAVSANVINVMKAHQKEQKKILIALGYDDVKLKSHMNNGLVFITLKADGSDITYIQPKNMYRSFKNLLRAAGLPKIRFHDLRHSFALLSLEAGVDIKTLQDDMGHERISTTLDSYGHVNIGMKKEAARKRAEVLN